MKDPIGKPPYTVMGSGIVQADDCEPIAEAFGDCTEAREARSAFIAEACTHHEALVEMVKRLNKAIWGCDIRSRTERDLIRKTATDAAALLAAIAKK